MSRFRRDPNVTRGWRRRFWRVASWAAAVLIVAVLVATFVSVPYEAITPGSTLNVENLISISPTHQQSTKGSVALVDVNVVPLRAIDYLFFRLNGANEIVPRAEILGSSSQSTYDEQGVLDMYSAQQSAMYVALNQLGYAVRAVPEHLVVYAIAPGSPAARGVISGSLSVGDVIRSIDGHAISTTTSIHDALARDRPGDLVQVIAQFFGTAGVHHVTLRLGKLRSLPTGAAGCVLDSQPLSGIGSSVGKACLGVELAQTYHFANLPFAVHLNANGIIGPSAGLAFTLGLMKALDKVSLTGGKRIVATGTMSMTGAIGDVGGVAQKTIAVRDSGATVFFVPKAEFNVAKARAGPHLRIVPVTSISQVVHALRQLGGKIISRLPR